ncbi:hypothetical protein PGT21_036971 [Puccinia graminis f. sp. tritici]|uniref:Uncharacterized protein n=1 Tax=Puccinia graminis f. sp. tritici TaxID=56615 RepID=A0A5B0QD73_PUCGR|nr:hypothetical protein PGT21_036971 [Puccinia graminis f. sp. tritici]
MQITSVFSILQRPAELDLDRPTAFCYFSLQVQYCLWVVHKIAWLSCSNLWLIQIAIK